MGHAGAHGVALPGGRVQHQGGTQAGEGTGLQQGKGRRRTGQRQGHAETRGFRHAEPSAALHTKRIASRRSCCGLTVLARPL
jgi:hypothetical protein